MKNRELFIGAVILGCLIAFFVSLKVTRIPIDPQHDYIGGCAGTRYGCCPNSRKACVNRRCTNCHLTPHHHHHDHHHKN